MVSGFVLLACANLFFFFFRKMNELMENIVFDKTGETKRNERYIEVITERQWIYLLVHN